MGGNNALAGTVTAVTHGMVTLMSAGGERYAALLPHADRHGVPPSCSIRRDRIAVTKALPCGAAMPAEPNAVCGTVHAIEYQGAYVKVTIQRPEHEDFVAHVADSDFFTQHLDIGDRVLARWAAEDVHLLETEHACKPGRTMVDQPYGQATTRPPCDVRRQRSVGESAMGLPY